MKHFIVTSGGIDLHVHSNFSDGSFSPEEVFAFARKAGLEAVGMCDHDNVRGYSAGAAAAKEHGVEFVPGIEFTTVWDGREHHILGYYCDPKESGLTKTIAGCLVERRARGRQSIEQLRAVGYDVPFSLLEEKGGFIDRGDILRYMMKQGWHEGTFSDGFRKFFWPDCAGYVLPYSVGGIEPMTVERAVRIIHGAGGVAVFGHPMGFYVTEMSRGELKQAADFGIDGLEVYHPRQSREVSDYLMSVCVELGLLVTGGTDCHGKVKDMPKMGTLRVSRDLLPPLKARAARWKSKRGEK